MIITEKKLMSDCGTCLVIDDGKPNPSDLYEVKFPEMKYIIIEIGAKSGSGLANLNEHEIFTSVKRIFEFKHYRKGGGKYWTKTAGISHFIIVPTDKIYLLPEKGYSYVKAEINGVKITFNVSGGGGSNGWTDYVDTITNISVGHKVKDIKKILEVCIRDKDIEALFPIRQLESDRLEEWHNMSDKVSDAGFLLSRNEKVT